MAFADGTFVRMDAGFNSDAGKVFIYKEDATLAAIRASCYLNDAAATYGLADGDIVMIVGNDGFGFSQMAVSDAGVVTVTEGLTSA